MSSPEAEHIITPPAEEERGRYLGGKSKEHPSSPTGRNAAYLGVSDRNTKRIS
ncbi:hypothetical protein FH972_022595 [Carpinus fangiana]|uniref:Uncharacterized protein n=1 Tax=Carpinus fangiana TaxID=176857 RepID=A0A5N6KT94_9ROSI|nr:hypothetical protein FH972_022595 [Carpinus fangiana]